MRREQHEPRPRRAPPMLEGGPRIVARERHPVEVVHAGATERPVRGRKAGRLDDVRGQADAGREPENRSGIGGDIRLVQGDVQPGDAVVTQGVLQLTDNAAVRLLDAPQGGGSGGGQQGQPNAQPPQGQDNGTSASAPQGNGQHKRNGGGQNQTASSAQGG